MKLTAIDGMIGVEERKIKTYMTDTTDRSQRDGLSKCLSYEWNYFLNRTKQGTLISMVGDCERKAPFCGLLRFAIRNDRKNGNGNINCLSMNKLLYLHP